MGILLVHGEEEVNIFGNALALLMGAALFPIMDQGSLGAFALGVCLTLGVVGFSYGPAGALLPEIFATRYRYTGAGMAYNIAGVLGGAVTPLLAAQLVGAFGSHAIGFYLSGLGLLSLLCMLGLRESKDNAMSETPAKTDAPAP